MKRRAFLGSLIAIPAAAWLSQNVLATAAPISGYAHGPITFKDIPVVYDTACPVNQMYFVAAGRPHVVNMTGRRM